MMSVQNYLDWQACGVVVSGTKSNLWPDGSDTPQGLLLGTILFKLFTNNLGKGMGCLLSKLVDDTKLHQEVDMLEGKALVQRDFNGLEKWTGRKFQSLSPVSGMVSW